MKAVWATFTRELKAYFYSPLAYLIMFFVLIVNGFIFAWMVSVLTDPRSPAGPPMEYFFRSTTLVLIVLGTLLPMRLLSEELKTGSIEVLMTAPVTEGQVVAGKYLAALVFYAFLWLPTLAYAGLVAYHEEVDWGPVVSGYLGLLLVGALFLAIGIFASALTRSQLLAAVITFALLLLLFLVGMLGDLATSETVKEALGYVNLGAHMDELSSGIVDTRRLVFYVSTTLFFLFLTSRSLESRKWR